MKNYYNFNLTNEQKQYAKETDDFLYCSVTIDVTPKMKKI